MVIISLPGEAVVKNLPASTGDMGDEGLIPGEDPLEKEMAIHSSFLAWEIPWTGAWQTTVHGVSKNRTQLSNCTCTRGNNHC